jgi:hypothetical protein
MGHGDENVALEDARSCNNDVTMSESEGGVTGTGLGHVLERPSQILSPSLQNMEGRGCCPVAIVVTRPGSSVARSGGRTRLRRSEGAADP